MADTTDTTGPAGASPRLAPATPADTQPPFAIAVAPAGVTLPTNVPDVRLATRTERAQRALATIEAARGLNAEARSLMARSDEAALAQLEAMAAKEGTA